LENDRNHPRKFKRPFASGDLQIWQGLLIIPILLIFSYLLSLQAGENFPKWLGVYFIITCFYSLKLKQIVLIDCIVLAILYTLRIVAGSASIGQSISFWLLAFSIFLFLSLAFLKRFAELQVQLIQANHKAMGRGYLTDDAPLIQTFGVSSGFLAALVLAFYLNSQNVIELYTSPVWIWCCIPVLVFWVNWIWLKAYRGEMHDYPLVFAVKDKTSVLSGIFFSLFLILGTFL
jgi:4-hydroxybenzoate polyprenyltransferase